MAPLCYLLPGKMSSYLGISWHKMYTIFNFGQKFTYINHQLTFSDVLCSKTKVFNQDGGKNVLYVCRNVCTRHFCICYFAFRRKLNDRFTIDDQISSIPIGNILTYKLLDSDITFEICWVSTVMDWNFWKFELLNFPADFPCCAKVKIRLQIRRFRSSNIQIHVQLNH